VVNIDGNQKSAMKIYGITIVFFHLFSKKVSPSASSTRNMHAAPTHPPNVETSTNSPPPPDLCHPPDGFPQPERIAALLLRKGDGSRRWHVLVFCGKIIGEMSPICPIRTQNNNHAKAKRAKPCTARNNRKKTRDGPVFRAANHKK